jgi:flavin reductase (DIM6/NTAB) family NADH-FMN oxidoreductase RutF
MPKIHFTHDQIQERPNTRYPTPDKATIHYHFRPARPANFCVTRDVVTHEVNVSAGTIGPLTWKPYTMCLHISIKGSPHTYANLSVGSECVIALPGRDIVAETWFTALPLPRGVSEMEVAGLHPCPSKLVDVPGIEECPVNFECKVEFRQDYYTHAIAFVRVLGATIEERVLSMSREEVVHWYPTYEVDDMTNRYGGSIERLGVMGELFACPTFPLAPKKGWYQSFPTWITELCDERYIDADTRDAILAWEREYVAVVEKSDDPRRNQLKDLITGGCRLIVTEKWDELAGLARGRRG